MNKYEDRSYKLQQVFQDTMEKIETNENLKKVTEQMMRDTVVYTHEIGVGHKPEKMNPDNITVVQDTTFSCASKETMNGRVAALNFANAIHPGGGVVGGALAQEECLCRSSNLYKGLTTPLMIEKYYRRNRRFSDRVGSDSVAYHPGVTVFKNDDLYAKTLPENEWFKVDVITCAAPRLSSRGCNPKKLFEIHVNRGRRIIESAIDNKAEILILGAFGCGAFANNPLVVAMAYKYLLCDEGYARYFKKVIFAIKKDHNDVKGNYAAFSNIFNPII